MQDSLIDAFIVTVVLTEKAQYSPPGDAHHVVAARKGIIGSGSTTDSCKLGIRTLVRTWCVCVCARVCECIPIYVHLSSVIMHGLID